jgi:hypothetical protein
MKKFIIYNLIAITFTAQNLFAQTETVVQEMDMKVYTRYMLAGLFVLIIIIFATLAFSASKEPVISGTTSKSFIGNPVISYSGLYLPSISLELNRLRILLISSLIMFSIILLLLLI